MLHDGVLMVSGWDVLMLHDGVLMVSGWNVLMLGDDVRVGCTNAT